MGTKLLGKVDSQNCREEKSLKTLCDNCGGYGLVDEKPEYKNENIGTFTVGELSKLISGMEDDALVTYQRIEDIYFEKHHWTPDLLVPDESAKIYLDYPMDEYINAFCGFEYMKDGQQYLCVTAHY